MRNKIELNYINYRNKVMSRFGEKYVISYPASATKKNLEKTVRSLTEKLKSAEGNSRYYKQQMNNANSKYDRTNKKSYQDDIRNFLRDE